MKVRDVLRVKGHNVVTITPDQTVLAAMRTLVERNIGSVVVMDGDDVAGILTERDALRLGARDPGGLANTRVRDAMTTDLVIGVPEDDLQYVMEIMTRNRIRHLPVLEEGRLIGILSIGDVVNALRTSVEAENRYLRDYIQGAVR
ncbi:MAG: CBS domain-containing protein [Gemmatimonadetes bacterium]|nr:CBS domain-containing protein [Gemmatimonadota bacterium]